MLLLSTKLITTEVEEAEDEVVDVVEAEAAEEVEAEVRLMCTDLLFFNIICIKIHSYQLLLKLILPCFLKHEKVVDAAVDVEEVV